METRQGKGGTISAVLARRVTATENQMATAPVERAVVFDEAGGILVDKEGERAEVSFTPEEVERMRGATVFTHNHPGGTSFSLPDILMAKRLNIQEMRVVTERELYILDAPSAGWPAIALRDLLRAVQAADTQVEEKLSAEIRARRISKVEANRRHWHEVWTRVSQRIGLRYIRRPR
jgi:hypothetical protein